jgi:hypothetical protein
MKLNLLFMFIIFALNFAMEQTSADAASASAIELFLADDTGCKCGSRYRCVRDEKCCPCICGDNRGVCTGCGTTHCCLLGMCKTLNTCNPSATPRFHWCRL